MNIMFGQEKQYDTGAAFTITENWKIDFLPQFTNSHTFKNFVLVYFIYQNHIQSQPLKTIDAFLQKKKNINIMIRMGNIGIISLATMTLKVSGHIKII